MAFFWSYQMFREIERERDIGRQGSARLRLEPGKDKITGRGRAGEDGGVFGSCLSSGRDAQKGYKGNV